MPKVLLVNDARGSADSADSAKLFGDATQVVEADSTGNAIELLSHQDFDALYMCDAKDGGESFRRMLQSEAVLDCVPLGVALLDSQKRIIRANLRLREALESTDLSGQSFYECLGEISIVGGDPSPLSSAMAKLVPCKATLEKDDKYYSLFATPIFNESNQCDQMVVTLRESTEQVIQQQKLVALHQAGSELTDLRPEEIYQMGFEDRIELLKDNIIHYTKDLLNFDVIEIRLLNAENGELTSLLSAGMDSGISQTTIIRKPRRQRRDGIRCRHGQKLSVRRHHRR